MNKHPVLDQELRSGVASDDWIARLKDSDIGVFEELYRSNFAGLVGFARTFTRDDEVARDVVQESFASIWQRRATLDDSGSVKAYLYKIVRNRSLNAIRNEKLRSVRHHEYSEDRVEESVPAVDAIDTKALGNRLRQWIESLPERQREALLLSRYEGLSHAEIADVMGVSPRTVNNHLVSALKSIRTNVAAFEPALLRA